MFFEMNPLSSWSGGGAWGLGPGVQGSTLLKPDGTCQHHKGRYNHNVATLSYPFPSGYLGRTPDEGLMPVGQID